MNYVGEERFDIIFVFTIPVQSEKSKTYVNVVSFPKKYSILFIFCFQCFGLFEEQAQVTQTKIDTNVSV